MDRNGLKLLIQATCLPLFSDGYSQGQGHCQVGRGTEGESKLAMGQSELHLEYHKNPHVEGSTSLG